jgi:hypothetical protein
MTRLRFSSVSRRESFDTTNPHDGVSEADHDVQNKLLTENDLFVKDAFLVFRALCKLTMKPLNTERWGLSAAHSTFCES